MASLKKLKGLEVKIVLPGHEYTFQDLDNRISDLIAHHKLRCWEIKEAIRYGAGTVFEISSKVHWDSRPWPLMSFWTKRMAAAETYAHLIYLKNKSEIEENNKKGTLQFSLI